MSLWLSSLWSIFLPWVLYHWYISYDHFIHDYKHSPNNKLEGVLPLFLSFLHFPFGGTQDATSPFYVIKAKVTWTLLHRVIYLYFFKYIYAWIIFKKSLLGHDGKLVTFVWLKLPLNHFLRRWNWTGSRASWSRLHESVDLVNARLNHK